MDDPNLDNQQEEPQPSKENTTPELNSVKIREEYSFEEIQNMLNDIDDLISEHKAANHGIDPENMVKTVRGGHVIWITKEELNATLAKKRKISNKKYVQRSIRGENNLSSEITRRVELCNTLLDIIRKVIPEETPDFVRKVRDLDIVRNRSLSLAKEIRLLETAIQRKRKEDPILSEMEKATHDMMSALEKNSLEDVDVCQSFRDRHMEEYLAKQKRIEPYIKKSQENRLAFLRTKQQIYQFEFDLLDQGQEILSQQLEEIIYHDREGKKSQELVKILQEIQTMIQNGRPLFQTLESYSDEELENQDGLFNKVDREYLVPLFDQFVCFVESFDQAWRQFVTREVQENNISTKQLEDTGNRSKSHMAYPEQRDSSSPH